MTSNRRLIVVSNRLPVSIERTGDSFALSPSSGGLVTALRSVFRKYDGCWIGWPGTAYSPAVEELLRSMPDFEFQVHPVFLTEEERLEFYSGFSNEIVWPLFHDLQSRCNFHPTYWDSYVAINNRFADRACKIAKDGDFIWVHDYHLTGVAASVRRMGLQATLSYFQHIPFPSPDIFEKLPWRTELLTSMLDFDLVGLQTFRDRQNFAVCVERFVPDVRIFAFGKQLAVEQAGRRTIVGDFPISIDFDEFASQAASPEVTGLTAQIRADMNGRSLLLGVDRLDYTKGLPEKLRAFSHLLEQFPQLRRKVTLLQVVVPSREDIPKYNELKLEIERMISEINGRFTDSGWAPIHFIYRRLDRQQLLAYYRAADVALVTPLKDGMNLVAKEYCAAQIGEQGVLVLSEFAGAASQLECGAIIVNPNDVAGVAQALQTAVVMKGNERVRRMKALRQAVRQADVYQWSKAFLEAAGRIIDVKDSIGRTESLGQSLNGRKRPPARLGLRGVRAVAQGVGSSVAALVGKSSGKARGAVPVQPIRPANY
jgi:alpha,alpha-trehalose-phosphate synthase [UDP-forming]